MNTETTAPAIVTQSPQIPTLKTAATEMRDWAATLVVSSPAEFEAATQKLTVIKDWKKRTEDDKEKLYRPIKTALDEVTLRYKDLLTTLDDAERIARRSITSYAAAEEEKRRKAAEAEQQRQRDEAIRQAAEREAALEKQRKQLEEDARARADELRKIGDEGMAASVEAQAQAGIQSMEDAHNVATDASFIAADTTRDVGKTIKTGAAAFTVRKVRKHRVLDITKVPAEYLLVDDVKVKAAMRAGVPSISGIEFYEEDEGSMRRVA